MHSFIHFPRPLVSKPRGDGGQLEPIPAVMDQSQADTHDKSPAQRDILLKPQHCVCARHTLKLHVQEQCGGMRLGWKGLKSCPLTPASVRV